MFSQEACPYGHLGKKVLFDYSAMQSPGQRRLQHEVDNEDH